jgi:hypothetical protein
LSSAAGHQARSSSSATAAGAQTALGAVAVGGPKLQPCPSVRLGRVVLGFDSDPISVFRSQIDLIQKSSVVVSMVGLLNTPRRTRLYQRLHRKHRLLEHVSGDSTDCSMNFVPKMDQDTLNNGYKQVITTVYSPKEYYRRVETFLRQYRPVRRGSVARLRPWHVRACFRSRWFLGRRSGPVLLLAVLHRDAGDAAADVPDINDFRRPRVPFLQDRPPVCRMPIQRMTA